jgi:hypothetical protein
MPLPHWVIGGTQPNISEQQTPFSQVNVGGQMAPSGPQPSGGGKQKSWTQHSPFTHMIPAGQAAPAPHPIIPPGTHRPLRHSDPPGHGMPRPHCCATHIPFVQTAPAGHIPHASTGTQTPF